MSIVVVDKSSGVVVDPSIEPVDGDWVRETHPDGSITEYEWHTPVAPEVIPIRIITVRAFMKRLAQSERIALRGSTDAIVIDLMEDLRMASYVDLDDPELGPGLAYVESLGLIANSQLTDLLVDGTEAEAYNGVL